MPQPNDEIRYRLMKLIRDNPDLSQRDMAERTGVSLGKVNYCLRALIDKGLIKATNFSNSSNKTAYLYKLTPHGIEEKARVTARFLKRKIAEYEILKQEIQELSREVGESDRVNSEQ
jgi:EPS-associated MarR family transcriptional regulator